MISLLKTPLLLVGTVFASGLFAAVATNPGRPGMVNYAEGVVKVGGQTIGSNQIGQTEVHPGEVLSTGQGKAEMLLTPGVLLRLNDNSQVRMVSPSLTDTR